MTDRTFTPPQLAKLWQSSPEKIICLIKRGDLRAFDTSLNPGVGRARWLITAEAIAEFQAQRAAVAPVKRRKRKPQGEVLDIIK